MNKKNNTHKIKNKLAKISAAIVIIIVILSTALLLSSLISEKKSSFSYTSFGNMIQTTGNRRFVLESEEENIYNLGDYQVNLTKDQLLVLNLSIKCTEASFTTLLRNKVLVQNAVIDAFSTYGSINFPNTESGKKIIKAKITQNIHQSLGYPLIKEVYFNKYIIQ